MQSPMGSGVEQLGLLSKLLSSAVTVCAVLPSWCSHVTAPPTRTVISSGWKSPCSMRTVPFIGAAVLVFVVLFEPVELCDALPETVALVHPPLPPYVTQPPAP